MRSRPSSFGFLPFVVALAFAPLGCGGEEKPDPEPSTCPAGDEIRGVCAGVPADALCEGQSCTDGVDCASVKSASDDASLGEALSSATPGTCIALAPGDYGPVTLPGGVSLLGRSAAEVTIGGLLVQAGGDSVVRGLAIDAVDGVYLDPDATAHLEAVRVTASQTSGIQISNGASMVLRNSAVAGGAWTGIRVVEGGSALVEASILEGNAGPGLSAACASECGCPAPPDVTLRHTIVRDNHVGGVLLFGATALLESVDIQGTLVGDDVAFGLGGGGLSAAGCAHLTAKDLHVEDNASFGILLDASDAMIGDPLGDPAIQVKGNAIGVWAQHISKSAPQTVTLDGLTVEESAGVGIGAAGDAVGLIICRSAVKKTKLASLLVEGGGSKEVGDGLLWLGATEIAIDGLTLDGNARASVVIDGEASGSMANVTLTGGDEEKGIVQQSYAGGSQPQIGAGTPAITTSPTALFALPKSPAVPPSDI